MWRTDTHEVVCTMMITAAHALRVRAWVYWKRVRKRMRLAFVTCNMYGRAMYFRSILRTHNWDTAAPRANGNGGSSLGSQAAQRHLSARVQFEDYAHNGPHAAGRLLSSNATYWLVFPRAATYSRDMCRLHYVIEAPWHNLAVCDRGWHRPGNR